MGLPHKRRDETFSELVRRVGVLPVHDDIAWDGISWASTRDDVALYSNWSSVSNYIGRQGIRSGRTKRRRLCGVFSDWWQALASLGYEIRRLRKKK